MILLSLALSCVGLHVGQGGVRDHESLPRPSISAWPSWMVPVNSKVTLRCSAPIREVIFVFRKGGLNVKSLPSTKSREGFVEFPFTDLQYGAAGEYTCDYHKGLKPNITSPSSDALLLVVTGQLPKPSLQGHPRGKVTAGETVTLQCQKPKHVIENHRFALLKKGTPTPIQFRRQGGKETDFSLRSVTINDTGNYSCVYYQTQVPFHASMPSDHIEIQVKGQCEGSQCPLQGQTDNWGKTLKRPEPSEQETGTYHSDETESAKTAGTLGTTEIILIVTFTSFFLLAAFLLMYKYACCGAGRNRATKRSHSSKNPEEVVTDASMAMMICSPALDEGSQESRAEEPHGVTYAELNARALSEGPSNQMKQPLETCVYSTLKT